MSLASVFTTHNRISFCHTGEKEPLRITEPPPDKEIRTETAK